MKTFMSKISMKKMMNETKTYTDEKIQELIDQMNGIGSQEELEKWDCEIADNYGNGGPIVFLSLYNGNDSELRIYERYRYNGKLYNTVIDTKNCIENGSGIISDDVKTAGTLKRVTIDDNVEFWDKFSMDRGQNLASMFGMFYQCTSVEYIKFGKVYSSYVTNMGSMFSTCNNLIRVDGLGNLNTSKVTNMISMFSDCLTLRELDLRGMDIRHRPYLDNMFKDCQRLERVLISEPLYAPPMADNIFQGCIISDFTYA